MDPKAPWLVVPLLASAPMVGTVPQSLGSVHEKGRAGAQTQAGVGIAGAEDAARGRRFHPSMRPPACLVRRAENLPVASALRNERPSRDGVVAWIVNAGMGVRHAARRAAGEAMDREKACAKISGPPHPPPRQGQPAPSVTVAIGVLANRVRPHAVRRQPARVHPVTRAPC